MIDLRQCCEIFFALRFSLGDQIRVIHHSQDRPPKKILIWNVLREHLLGWLKKLLPKTKKLPPMHVVMIHLHGTSPKDLLHLCAAPRYKFWSVRINDLVTTRSPVEQPKFQQIYFLWIFPDAPVREQSCALDRENIHIPNLSYYFYFHGFY